MIEKAAASLTTAQKSKIALLVQATMELTEEERLVANRRYRDSYEKVIGIDPALYTDFSPKIEKGADGQWPEWKEESFNVAGHMGSIKSVPAGVVDAVEKGWKISLINKSSSSASASKAESAPKPEVPKIEEKTTFNLMLKTVPPEAKIKLIKEIKGMMNIGLKEAKDQVESVAKQPLMVYKNIQKADGEAKLKKLLEAGGVAELV